jgi:hypothetical protein
MMYFCQRVGELHRLKALHLIYLPPVSFFPPHRIEKLQRDILWVGMSKEFKLHLVSWTKVCTLISKGGLGVWNLLLLVFNLTLLKKWHWRYVHEREVLRSVVMDSKFSSA